MLLSYSITTAFTVIVIDLRRLLMSELQLGLTANLWHDIVDRVTDTSGLRRNVSVRMVLGQCLNEELKLSLEEACSMIRNT